MTNIENIRNMTDEELCDYIYSVFLTGKSYGQLNKSVEDAPDYLKWLQSEKTMPNLSEMRPATEEERSAVDAYIEAISTKTPVNIKDFFER